MNIPSKLKYNSKLYETISLITINDLNFLIAKENEIMYVEIKNNNGNLSFDLLHDIKKEKNISEHLFISYIIAGTKEKDINALKNYFLDISQYINSSEVGKYLKQANENFDMNTIIDYLDNNVPNLKEITEFNFGDSSYLKYIDNGSKVLENNEENKNFINEFNNKKNKKEYQKTIGIHPNLKNAAFADTLLLSLIVGAIGGFYLAFLLLAII